MSVINSKRLVAAIAIVLSIILLEVKKVETQVVSTLSWGVPANSVASTTTTVNGTAYALISNPAALVTATVDVTGSVATLTTRIEGSNDNSTWHMLEQSTTATDHAFSIATSLKYVRATVNSVGAGGGSIVIDLIAKGNFWTAASLFTGGAVTGDITLTNNADLIINTGGSIMNSSGIILLQNTPATGFDRLQFGGTTSSFPALKRSSASLQARFADDSGFAALTMSTAQIQGSITTGASFNRIWQQSSNVTIASGFGTSPAIVTNGTYGVEVTVGTGGADSSGVLTFSAASIGWNCFATNITTTSTTVFMTKQTASTTTTATLTNYNNAAVPAPWVAGDKLRINCFGY